MTSRDTIFASIRRSLHVKGDERIRTAIVEERLDRAPKGVVPARAQLDAAGKLALFIEKAEGVQATVSRVPSAKEVPGEVARYLRDNNLPAALRMGDDPRLSAMPWKETALDVTTGRSNGLDLSGITHAETAIAETGTLAILSGHENPTPWNSTPFEPSLLLPRSRPSSPWRAGASGRRAISASAAAMRAFGFAVRAGAPRRSHASSLRAALRLH